MEKAVEVMLIENVVSGNKVMYGKAGDKVTVLHERGNMLIVKNDKETFSVRKEKTTWK